MPAGTKNFSIEQGAVFKPKISVLDRNRAPISLSGYRAVMQIRTGPEPDAPLLAELSTENGRITIVPDSGVLNLYLPGTVTRLLTVRNAVYTLELVPPTGAADTFRLLQGLVTVSPSIVRP